jgi:hypothetical protein
VLCFLELCITGSVYANPPRPLLKQVVALTRGLFAEAGMRMDPALHLPSAFVEAGLPVPAMWLDKVSSPDGVDPGYIRWILDALAVMQRERSGTPGSRLDELDRRLRAEACESWPSCGLRMARFSMDRFPACRCSFSPPAARGADDRARHRWRTPATTMDGTSSSPPTVDHQRTRPGCTTSAPTPT